MDDEESLNPKAAGELAALGADLHMEQALAGLRSLAALIRGYYEQLLEQGFTEDEALALTAGLQDSIQQQGKAP